MHNARYILRLMIRLVFFLAVIVLVGPSVSFMGVNLKQFSTALLLVILIPTPLYTRTFDFQKINPFLIRSVLFFMIILFYGMLGLFNRFDLNSVLAQSKAILNAYIIFALFRVIIWLDLVNKREIYLAVIVGAVVFFIAKIYILIMLITDKWDIAVFAELMQNMLGPDTAPPVNLAEGVIRLQLPNEIIGIFALGVLWFSSFDGFSRRWVNYSATILITIGVVSTMSRFFAVWVAILILYKLTSQFAYKKSVKVAAFFVVMGVILIIIFWQELSTTIFMRYNPGNEDVDFGDYLRKIQYVALASEFFHHPFLGTGLGGYSHEVIRNEFNPWMYEAQLPALFMQIGLVGILALTIVTMNIRTLGEGILWRLNVGWSLVFGGWLLACISNPYLLSSLTGVMFWLCKNNIMNPSETGCIPSSETHSPTPSAGGRGTAGRSKF